MLSGVLQGVDVDGDAWTLRLTGPGALQVINQPGTDGTTPVPLGQAGLINTINYQGVNPGESRLIGAVQKGPNGDGKVFFQNLVSPPSDSPGPGIGVGILAIDMPDFWLGDTSPGDTAQVQGTISIPDGVATLNFGGVDTTAFFGTDPADQLNQNNQSDRFTISLGLPTRVGTSINVDRIVTANQAASGTQAATQDTVTITVAGRLNVFQANSIEGDPTLDLGDSGTFQGDNLGGTTIISQAPQTGSSTVVTGAIGRFRVGGNATNLSVQVSGLESRLTNFFIGGETNKVTVTAGVGVRSAQFGLGMDTVSIQAGQIEQLSSNRGAIGSSVLVDREGGSMVFGGDVSNTSVFAGYNPASSADALPTAKDGGTMTVRVAGDVFDSLFAASIQPGNGMFGSSDSLVLPSGYINAKVEGSIDNSLNPLVDPSATDQAFFAKRLRLENGPIVPPAAPGAPIDPGSDLAEPLVSAASPVGPRVRPSASSNDRTPVEIPDRDG